MRDQETTPLPHSPNGLIEKASDVTEQLANCLRLSAGIRGDLFGEGESIAEVSKGQPSTLEGILYELLSRACDLRNQLERIEGGICSSKLKPQQPSMLTRRA